jgi:hypothetical protein
MILLLELIVSLASSGAPVDREFRACELFRRSPLHADLGPTTFYSFPHPIGLAAFRVSHLRAQLRLKNLREVSRAQIGTVPNDP